MSKLTKDKINWFVWFQGLLFIIASAIMIQLISNHEIVTYNVRRFFHVLSPFILGAVIAYLLNNPSKSLEEKFLTVKKLPFISSYAKGLSIFTVYILLISAMTLLINVLFPMIAQNIFDFISSMPLFYNELEIWSYNLDFNFLNTLFNIEETISSFFETFSMQDVFLHVTTGLNSMVNIALNMTGWIIDLAIAIIISIYILLYKKTIFQSSNRFFKLFMKENQVKTLKTYVIQANTIFYKFIATQFLDACILAVLSTILLAVLNVRFAVTLGFFLGVCNMIPKFGSIFGSIITIILAFSTGGVTQGIAVAISLTILQQIDGNIIGPKLMGDALDINPIVVFMALTFGGAYFGIVGMFLSIPVVAMLKIICMELIEVREKNLKEKVMNN